MGKISVSIFAAIPIVFLTTTIIGAVRWYSPVPFWDMWDSYIFTYLLGLEGHWEVFFGQVNEHRILFSQILFWLDLRYFGGRSLLLIPANIIFALALWLTLTAAAKRLLADRRDLWIIVSASLAAPLLSWMQEPNITWGYQSSFFLAYLFPLLAFICLAKSAERLQRIWWFAAALIIGLASIGTMANGLFVLPLLVLMLLLMERLSWPRIVATALLGAGSILVWFHFYTFVPREPARFGQLVTFLLTFLGLPFVRISGSLIVGAFASLFFMGASIWFAIAWLRRREQCDPIFLALTMFLAYIGVTAIVIAFGRASATENAALVQRYATPMLAAWSVLMILFAYTFKYRTWARGAYSLVGVFTALALLNTQLEVFSEFGPTTVHQKASAALALKLGIMDFDTINYIFPTDTPEHRDRIRMATEGAKKNHLSIFSEPKLERAVSKIGMPSATGFHACQGIFDSVQPINGQDNYDHAAGWAFDPTVNRVPEFVYFLSDGAIVGVGVTGYPRPDVASLISKSARHSGFDGYVAAGAGMTFSIVCADPTI